MAKPFNVSVGSGCSFLNLQKCMQTVLSRNMKHNELFKWLFVAANFGVEEL